VGAVSSCGASGGLRALAPPLPIPAFSVKQHGLSRFHVDPAKRGMREVCAGLFGRQAACRRRQALLAEGS